MASTKLECWSFEGTEYPVKSEKQKLPQVMERMRKKESVERRENDSMKEKSGLENHTKACLYHSELQWPCLNNYKIFVKFNF